MNQRSLSKRSNDTHMSRRAAMSGLAILSGLFLTASTVAFADDTRGTREEQAACRNDTRRFCRSVDPDSGTHGILNCLKQNRSKLSRACRGLLESHGQ
jgi:hypothetical protein